jgi:DNA topoisomerase-6 subunit B
VPKEEKRYTLIVEDNGPGIVKTQIPNIFGKLLYGSKFHRLRQSRGQQGIGISAAGMYGQLTTGKPVRVISAAPASASDAHASLIDRHRKNKPEIRRQEIEWDKDHGTRVEIDMEAEFRRAFARSTSTSSRRRSPTRTCADYKIPGARTSSTSAAPRSCPTRPIEIKPHPHGVELGA